VDSLRSQYPKGREVTEVDKPIRKAKAEFANRAIRSENIRSLADLGGCWGVNAGYTLDIIARNSIDQAYVVDQRITDLSRQKAAKYPQVHFVEGWFDQRSTAERVPDVDSVLMFDVLLHQVKPDWDDVLALWAKKTKSFIIYNQMWFKDNDTVRFIERGFEWYRDNVYFTDEQKLAAWFASHGRIDAASGKKQEDRHAFWQWGITPDDLVRRMQELGFKLKARENHGRFPPAKQAWIQDEAYVFSRG
jgi:hypothetical protein